MSVGVPSGAMVAPPLQELTLCVGSTPSRVHLTRSCETKWYLRQQQQTPQASTMPGSAANVVDAPAPAAARVADDALVVLLEDVVAVVHGVVEQAAACSTR